MAILLLAEHDNASLNDQTAKALRLPGNAVRVHFDVDVGGSYGVKRGIKHTLLVSYLAMKLRAPVRFLEDRLENMRGGDMHGPDRIFDMQVAFDHDGTIRAFKEKGVWTEAAQKHNDSLVKRQQVMMDAWKAYSTNAPSDDKAFRTGWMAARRAALTAAGLEVGYDEAG